MFDDYHWDKRRYTPQNARYQEFKRTPGRTLILEVGCGTRVNTARYEARMFPGDKVHVRINPNPGEGRSDINLHLGAIEGIKAITGA